MHKYTQFLVSTSLTITLAACGGSSDTSNQNIGSSQNTASSTKTISLYTLDRNEQPYQATVVLHDSEGKVILTQTSDNTGHFSAEVSDNAKHISIIGYSYSDRKIYTELNIEEGGSLGNFYFYDPKKTSPIAPPTSCTWVTVDISELTQVTYNNYELEYWQVPLGYDGSRKPLTTSSEICFDPDQETAKSILFTLTAPNGSNSTAALITLDESVTSFQLTSEDFVHEGTLVQPQLSASVNQVISRSYIEHDFNHIVSPTNDTSIDNLSPIFIFPSITEHNFIYQYANESININGADVHLQTHSRSYINSDGQVKLNELPESIHSLSNDVINLTQGQSLSYDFSQTDTRFSRARWDLSFTINDENADWYIYGPTSANIPNLEFGDAFPTPTEGIQFWSVRLGLFGYVDAPTDYLQFRSFVNKRKPNWAFLTQPEYHQSVGSSIQIYFNH
ncbi:hypothetical protein BGP78_21260 [Pseudoalteromonas sp. MSK9-3]|uniref:hypothetical protein n=1 Tax=Pseudoalteromonas sp. MSK9-3 TaxID=1897633 RepID=UPI000E6C485D|nr:hypothetical protein [Pseudoalteromonas sp. MSK9-3]RJE71014.1 hypothetical protein BGP78_21260 [Pseudoalteromonas sp. MSK9-3]